MKKNLLKLPLLIFILFSTSVCAQFDNFLDNKEYRNNYISFANISSGKASLLPTMKESLLKDLTGNNNDITYRKTVLVIPFKNGKKIHQEKYQLYKKGVKLRGGEYLINIIDETSGFIQGFLAQTSNENFEEKYSEQVCVKLAIERFNQSYQITDKTNAMAGIADTSLAIYYYDNARVEYRPAYQVQITSKNSSYSENVFINAATGEFMGAESLVCTVNFPGSAQTQYSGTRNIVTDAPTAAGPYRLQQTRSTNNVLIRTRNMNNRTDLTNVTDFFDNDNNWTAAEHGVDRAALDAHWGAEMVFDYWLNVHNRNSINGNGMTIDSYVHLDVPNDPDNFNARWFQNSMQYGDGFFGTNPLTSLDICAHEIGHGIDQFTGDLLYERESGALDEGFADIWGASVEAWADPTKNRWLIGEEVWGGPIRSMSNPNAFGQPDTYLGTNWVNQVGCSPSNANDGCGVHTNSGVLNYWFFLLSEGGSGTNDIGNAFSLSGLGINTAADIAYATKLLTTASTNYSTCRALSIQAATILYGANSCEVKAVTNAWYAVGVGNAYPIIFSQIKYGEDCNTIEVKTTLPSNSNITWTTTEGMLINGFPSPQTFTGNSALISSTNGNYANITATFNGCITNTTGFCPCPTWPGNPEITWIWSSPAQGEPLVAYVSPADPNVDRYIWMVDGQVIQDGPETELLAFDYPCTWEKDLIVIAVYGCGASAPVNGGPYSPLCSGSRSVQNVVVYPNPASSVLNVKLKESGFLGEKGEKQQGNLSQILSITLFDKTGRQKKKLPFAKGNRQVEITVSELPSDVYYLEVSDGIQKTRIPVIIKR